jgi:DNA-binding CsgD family transcriptional regulator
MNAPAPNIQRVEGGYQLGKLVAKNLPPQQSRVLLMRASGMQLAQCAAALNCSINNISGIMRSLFCKLHADSSAELITRAFENEYLRFLSIFFAVFFGFLGNSLTDQNAIARLTARPRPGTQQRTRTGVRTRNENGLYWSPDTNQLIFS